MGAAAPKPLLAHSSRQQADGYSGNANKNRLVLDLWAVFILEARHD